VIQALKTLQGMNAPEAVPAILPLLNSSEGQVICETCQTLAILGDTNVIPLIEPLLKGSPNLKKYGPSLSIVAASRRGKVEDEIKKEAQDAIAKLQAKPSHNSPQTTAQSP
jgi:HEAT repeat protein